MSAFSFQRIAVVAAVATGVISCDKSQEKPGNSAPDAKQAFEAKPYNREIYRRHDDSKTIILISRDECEVKQGGKTFLCKYTKQDDALRVVMSVMGSTEVVYYKIVPHGLKEENGPILRNEIQYNALKKAQEDAARVESEKIAALIAESKQQTEPIFKFRVRGWIEPPPSSGDVLVMKNYVDITVVREGKKLHDLVWYGDIERLPAYWRGDIDFGIRAPGNGYQGGFSDFKFKFEKDQDGAALTQRFNSAVTDWKNRYGAITEEYEKTHPRFER